MPWLLRGMVGGRHGYRRRGARLRDIDLDALSASVDLDAFCQRAERYFWQSLDCTDYIADSNYDAASFFGIELPLL